MILELQDVAAAIGSADSPAPAAIRAWSTDSRAIGPGALFFALRGEQFDGHAYLDDAFAQGAVAAVVDRPVQSDGHTLLQVPDVLAALQSAAALARSRYGGDVVAVTGSAGKTTTKDIIAALLTARMTVGKTSGNFNNHIGLPLTLLRLPADSRVAVIEIGMNHADEIRRLAAVARPNIAVVTNVGYAHIENFDSVDGIAAAKRELVEALPADGVAVLNADDVRVVRFAEACRGRAITFGIENEAAVRARDVSLSPDGARFEVDGTILESSLTGRFGVLNILAGLAVARIFGIAPEELRDAVRALAPGKMRGERFTRAGVTVWNDCYNSNPDAARSMLEALRDTPARRRIAVLGEMRELGRWAETLHRGVGRYAVECGITVLVGIRGAARYMVDEAITAGLAASAAYFFEDPAEAGSAVRNLVSEGDAILFKGSRGTRVELALDAFLR